LSSLIYPDFDFACEWVSKHQANREKADFTGFIEGFASSAVRACTAICSESDRREASGEMYTLRYGKVGFIRTRQAPTLQILQSDSRRAGPIRRICAQLAADVWPFN
jgi:hypothetical protein